LGQGSGKSRKIHNFFVDILKNMRIIGFCMDTKKDCKIPECGDLAKLRQCKLVVGAKQLRKALERGTAKFVCLAKNADPAITAPIEENCIQKGISVTWVCTMQELGALCGIEVGAAAAAAVD
jgi:large subunit ribosomal protein L7A